MTQEVGIRLEDFLVERREAIRYDAEELQLRLEMEHVAEFIGKPSSYRFRGTTVILKFFNIEAECALSKLGSTPEEVLLRLRTNNRWILRKVGYRVEVASVKSMLPTESEFETAKQLLGVYPAYELIIRGMGYRVEQDVIRLLLPRIMPLVVEEYPFHVVQLTPPESGKTFFGVWAMKVCGWFYTTSPPTPAGMFYDARTGTYGFAMVSNGVVFDEIDKWSSSYINQIGLLTYIPTFLENGVVVRPTSRLHTLGVVEKLINTVWFGNSPQQFGNEKSVIYQIFALWGDTGGALADRMTIVHVEDETIRISDYVEPTVLPETLMYAILWLVRKMPVDRQAITSQLRGRGKRHSFAIQTALQRLGIEYSYRIVDEVVVNGWATVWKYRGGLA